MQEMIVSTETVSRKKAALANFIQLCFSAGVIALFDLKKAIVAIKEATSESTAAK